MLWTLLEHKSLQSSSGFELHLAYTGTFLPRLSFGAHQLIKVLNTEPALLLLYLLVYVLDVKPGIRSLIYEDIYRNCGTCLWLGVSWQFPVRLSPSATRAQPGSPDSSAKREFQVRDSGLTKLWSFLSYLWIYMLSSFNHAWPLHDFFFFFCKYQSQNHPVGRDL